MKWIKEVMGNNIVIAGWEQIAQAKDQMYRLLDPLGLMVEASRRAAENTKLSNVLQDVDAAFSVVDMAAAVLLMSEDSAGRTCPKTNLNCAEFI